MMSRFLGTSVEELECLEMGVEMHSPFRPETTLSGLHTI